MTANPFAANYVAPEPKPEPVKVARAVLIDRPGAYPEISMRDYHRATNLCPAPSLSSSGIKTLLDKSARHYWFDSTMNLERPAESDKPHFALGRGIHDRLLTPDCFTGDHYHVVPDGFTPAHHKKWEDDMPAWQDAVAKGKTILKASDAAAIERMAAAVAEHELASALLISGTPEMTLAWQDQLTGVWLKVRPDVTPEMRAIIPDVKSELDPSPDAFEKKADNLRYLHSAALYMDGLDAIYGEEKRRFVFIVIEKTEPHTVTLYQPDETDIHRARMENRWAINLFAECLKRGTHREAWPSYSDAVLPLGMPGWTRKRIDAAAENGTLSYHA
jgi:PDDEXK-like domain of unknown function (DUF3799)